MNILKFNDELSDQEKFLGTKIPAYKPKFRNQFCVTGKKYEYEDLSKVAVNKDKLTIVPKIFSTDPEAKTIEYVGVYSIGILELLYLGLCSSKEDDCHGSVADFSSMFTSSVSNLFSDYEEVENVYDVMSSLAVENGRFNEAFNIYFMLRTSYDRSGHETLLRYADWLMLIWLTDPQTYWEIFFDIMEFAKLSMLTLFKDFINPDVDFDVKQPWLKDDFDLKFGTIEYNIPNTEKVRKITDCRGIGIHLVMSLYYRILYNYGYDCERVPAIACKDDRIIKYIDDTIKSCIGEDHQSKILKGVGTNQKAEFNTLGMLVYSQPNNVTFTINNQKFIKHYYEELVLFNIRYGVDKIHCNKNINMHYSNIYNIFAAIGELWYLSSAKIMVAHDEMYLKAIAKLKAGNDKLEAEVARQQKLVQSTEERYKNAQNEEIEQLKKQLAEAQSIIESKNETIDSLVNKNKDLNKFVSSIYDDDFEEESEEEQKSIEEMVKELNDYKIVLIGGRFELPSKLNEYGWMNIKQYDNNSLCTGMDSISYADFVVINTKFVSHTTVHKAESMIEDSSLVMSYNGTNPEKLISAMYDFIMRYFEKE